MLRGRLDASPSAHTPFGFIEICARVVRASGRDQLALVNSTRTTTHTEVSDAELLLCRGRTHSRYIAAKGVDDDNGTVECDSTYTSTYKYAEVAPLLDAREKFQQVLTLK